MARYSGRSGRVYMSTSAAGTATPTVSIAHWELDMTTNTSNVTSFEDLNNQYVQDKPDLKGTISGFWNDTDSTLFTARNSLTPCNAYFYANTSAASKYAYGPIWLSIKMTTPVSGGVTISGTFVAGGDWGINY